MAEDQIPKAKCDVEGCSVAVDGKCLEGLELSKCSHISYTSEGSDIVSTAATEDQKPVDEKLPTEPVHSGEALDVEGCNKITLSSLTRFIILAGLPNSGKTTLLCSLFQLFQQESSFAKYLFAGSETLIGFERRSHESRITSGREREDTPRTVIEPPKFLHLKVQGEGKLNVDLLFTDISGEEFKTLSNSTDRCKEFELAKRADHFVLFMDSGLLTTEENKHLTKTNSLNVLNSLMDAEMLDVDTYIEIIFSRWDLLMEKDDNESHQKFIEAIKSEILKKFSKTHKRIKFYEIASRPRTTGVLKFGHGIDELFLSWVETSPSILEKIDVSINPKVLGKVSREFSKYQYLKELL